jgi:hypothetical protein
VLEFDGQYVVGYGLLFTGVLALAFVPSFSRPPPASRRRTSRAAAASARSNGTGREG